MQELVHMGGCWEGTAKEPQFGRRPAAEDGNEGEQFRRDSVVVAFLVPGEKGFAVSRKR